MGTNKRGLYMWYWILSFILAAWVTIDAKKRKNNFIGWGLGSLVAGPLLIPIYMAKRYLKDKEVRSGGTAWNVLKNFALFWTLFMFVAIIAGMINVGNSTSELATDAEKVGTAIGAGLGLGLLVALWFFPMVFAIVLGFFVKNSGKIEHGPTGKLATNAVIAA